MKENIDNHLKDDRGAIILKYDTISVVFFLQLRCRHEPSRHQQQKGWSIFCSQLQGRLKNGQSKRLHHRLPRVYGEDSA